MNQKKIILYGGLIYILFYSWLSVYFFIQRCAFIDGSWMLVNMINNKTFYIPLHRFSLAVTEWLPLIGVKIGMPFPSIAILYSISYPVLFLILFLLCIFWLKDYWAALCLILVTCIGVKYTFYVLPLEGIIGVTIGVVALSWCKKTNDKISFNDMLIALLFSFLIVFAHPLNFIAVLLCCGFLILETWQVRFNRTILLSLLMVIIFILKNLLLPLNPYETDITEGVYNNIGNFFLLQSHPVFLKRLIHDYYWLPVIFIGISTLLLTSKKYMQALWYFISVFCFVALVNLRNYDSSFQFYIEHSFLSLPLIIVFPIIILTEKIRAKSNAVTAILSLLAIVAGERSVAIYSAHLYFDNRIERQIKLSEKALLSESKRIVICEENLQNITDLVPGKLPYETLFLSKIFFNQDAAVSTSKNNHALKNADSLVIYETELRVDKLNPQYFHFPNKAANFICR